MRLTCISIFVILLMSCQSTIKVEKNFDLYKLQLEENFEKNNNETIKYLLDNPPENIKLEYYKYLVQYYYKNNNMTSLENIYLSKENSFIKFYVLGLVNFAKGIYNYDEAVNMFEKALLLANSYKNSLSEFYYNFALFYDGKENTEKALQNIDTAIKTEQNNKYYLFKANLLAKKGEFDKAKNVLNDTFNSLQSEKDMKKGYHLMQKITASNKVIPEELKPIYERWIVGLEANKHIYYIIEGAKKAKDKYPNLAEIYTILGLAYYMMDNKSEAFVNLDKAISLDPIRSENYFHLGVLYFGVKQFEKAKENFDKAISLNKYSPNVYKYLSKVETEFGNIENAIKYKNMELKFDKNITSYLELDTLYSNSQNVTSRKELLENIIKEFPEESEPYKRIIDLYNTIVTTELNPEEKKKHLKKITEYEILFKEKQEAETDKQMIKSEVSSSLGNEQ